MPHSVSPTQLDFLFRDTACPIKPVTLSSFVVRTSREALKPIKRLSSASLSKTRTKDCLNCEDVKLSVSTMCPPVEFARLFISSNPTSSVELAALLSVPLLLRYRENLSAWIWRGGVVLIIASLTIQLASLAFWLPLEIYQMETLGHPTFVIALRFKNIGAFALGKMQAWGLNNEAMTQDPWDYVHITTWNFLPFLLGRVGAAPGWVVDTTFAVWGAAIAALLVVVWRLRTFLRRQTGSPRA